MPIRSSRSRAAVPAHATVPSWMNRALAYHASQITVLWIIVVFMTLAGFLVMLSYMLRLGTAERGLVDAQRHLLLLEASFEKLSANSVVQPSVTQLPVVQPTHSAPATTLGLPSTSPSGALDRGSLSPDGSRYAGYNDTVKGKIGMAVEIIATGKVRYIDIFDPRTDSTGSGTASEAAMSVRWKDASTIEYDVLVTKNGVQTKEARTTKIYF